MLLRMPLNKNSLNHMIGDTVLTHRALSSDAWYVRVEGGGELVVKQVPRQERRFWKEGNPWTELIVLDLLAAEGGPVPRLLAADLSLGFLIMEFVPGQSLRSITLNPHIQEEPEIDPPIVSALVRALIQVENILHQEQVVVAPYLVMPDETDRDRFAQRVGQALDGKARAAWLSLVKDGFGSEREAATGTLGSVDVQPDNALIHDGRITLLDFATVGRQDRERRIVGYVHRFQPDPGTWLDEKAYEMYAGAYGTNAAVRLALYDFAYTLKVLEMANTPTPTHNPGHVSQALTMWQRPRMPDERIERVRQVVPRI